MRRRKKLAIQAQNQISADQAGLAVKDFSVYLPSCLLQLPSPREGCDAGFRPNYDAQEAETMSVLQ